MDIALAASQVLHDFDQQESHRREEFLKSKRRAEYLRPISALFFRYAESPQNPEMLQMDLVQAKYFKEIADIEERFIARSLQRNGEIADLREKIQALRERALREDERPN